MRSGMLHGALVLAGLAMAADAGAAEDDYWCYKCPGGYALSGEYCLPASGEGSTAKPVWARPHWAKVVWSKPSTCASFTYTDADGEWCGSCPSSYTWLSSSGDPEFCATCDPGFTLVKGRGGSYARVGSGGAAGFAGAWSCPGRGTLTVSASGSAVTGSYPWSGGGSISGTVTGSTMSATWTGNTGGTGNWTMTLSADGSRIDGTWNHATGGGGSWGCTRAASTGTGTTSGGETCEWREGSTVFAGGCVCSDSAGAVWTAEASRCGH